MRLFIVLIVVALLALSVIALMAVGLCLGMAYLMCWLCGSPTGWGVRYCP